MRGLFVTAMLTSAVARGEPPSPLWDDVARPDRLKCAALVEEGRRKMASRLPVDRERALAALGEAARRCPAHREAQALLGQARARGGDYGGARAALERARALAPAGDDRDPDLAFELGLVRSLDGDLEGSLAEYRRVEAIAPFKHGWKLYYNMGDDLMALGRLGEAIVAYRRAVRLSPPTVPIARFALAVALDRDEQFERARAELQVALAIDKQLTRLLSDEFLFIPPAERHYYLALCHQALGRYEEARTAVEAFLRELPDSPYAFRAEALRPALSR